jgi:hypothetical protein
VEPTIPSSGVTVDAKLYSCQEISWKTYYRLDFDIKAVLLFGEKTKGQEECEKESQADSKEESQN